MDTRSGEMVFGEQIKRWMDTIEVGEIVKVKSSEFIVKDIKRDGMLTLQLLDETSVTMSEMHEHFNRHERREHELMHHTDMKK